MLRGRDNAFIIQPIARGYANLYRAVATAIIYRFARINCGFGASEAELADTDRIDEVRAARSALRVRNAPGHVIQVIFAQWLAVYVGLQLGRSSAVGTFAAMRPADGLEVVNDPRAVLADEGGVLGRVQAGATLLAPFAVLAYLVDWYGAVQPVVHAYQPAVAVYQQDLLPLARVLLLSTLPRASGVATALRTGLGADSNAAYAALAKLFKEGSEVQVRAVQGTSPTRLLLAAHCLAAGAMDEAVQPHGEAEAETVSAAVTISGANTALLLQPTSAVVVFTANGKVADALLNRTHEEAPLQYVAVNASIAAVCRRAPAATASEVTAQTWALYPTADKGTIQCEVDRVLAAVPRRSVVAAAAAGSTTAAPRGSARKPLPLRPGRWFTQGPNVVAVYLVQRAHKSKDVRRATAALFHFFARYAVLRDEASGRAFIAEQGVPTVELVKRGSGGGTGSGSDAAYEQRALLKSVPSTVTLTPKTELPFVSIVLGRENLLWFAAVEAARPRAILEALWNVHHVGNVAGRRFDDAASADLIRLVISRRYTHAQKWAPAAMLELLFLPDDAVAAGLVHELEELMLATAVAVSGEETYYGERQRGMRCTATHIFQDVAGGGDDLMLVPLPRPQDVAVDRWSEWFVHGLCFTTTQLALLFAVGEEAALAALRVLVDACVIRSLGMGDAFRDLAQTDKMEMFRRFSESAPADGRSGVTLTA